jgi:hypothetical protein
MPTATKDLRPNKAADRRLKEHQDRMIQAHARDARVGPDGKQRYQWQVVAGWLMSEAKCLNDADRARMFQHLIECGQQMNGWTRRD